MPMKKKKPRGVAEIGLEQEMVRARQRRLGEYVRRARQRKGLGSPSEAAALLGPTSSWLTQVENGSMPLIPEARVKELAEAFDANFEEMMALAGRVPRELASVFEARPKKVARLLLAVAWLADGELDWILDRAEGLARASQ